MAKIQPGLERIAALLKDVSFPWKSIHVAGTNGKGSICHYASSLMVGRSIKTGKFTSPHLVDRWDCISINGKTIEERKFRTIEKHFLQINAKHQIGASPFEILTATAFTIFNDARVEVGVVEVGMGGKLDTTNILNNQAVSVISKIARDHEGFLGNSLAEIAGHKAGILRPDVPYIVNAANEANVQTVIEDYAREIGAGPRLSTSDFQLTERLYDTKKWQRVTATMAPFQEENLKLAVVAVMQTLHSIDQNPKHGLKDIAKTLLANLKNRHHGRQEFVHVTPVFKNATERRNHVLVDGAHNPDAATALDGFVRDTLRRGQSPTKGRPASGWPVTWVLAMTEGKDAHRYLATLLKPGDKVVTTTFGPVDGMPWVKPMDPKKLLEICKSIEPQITGVHIPVIGALRAICTAKYMSDQGAAWSPIVLTGSLYLVGDLHRELRPRSAKTWWTDTDEAITADRESFLKIQAEERERVGAVLSSALGSREGAVSEYEEPEAKEQRKLQEELDALNREVQGLEIEEKRLAEDHSATLDTLGGVASLSAAERLERDERRFAELHLTPEQLTAQIARAEKAEADLVRHTEMIEAAKQERQARLEKRAKQKERLEARRERRAERKAQLKQMQAERKEQAQEIQVLRKGRALRDKLPKVTSTRELNAQSASPREQSAHPAHKNSQESSSMSDKSKAPPPSAPYASKENAKCGDEEPQDALSILTANRPKTLSSGKHKAAIREAPRDITTNKYHLGHEDGPSILSKPELKNIFFGKSASSASQTPKTSSTSADPQDASRETAASRDPRDRRKTPAQRKSHERRTQPKHEIPDKHMYWRQHKPAGVRITMHYANAAGPGKGKMRAFPLDRKTRAWSAQSNSNPEHKMAGSNSINYHERENRTKSKDDEARSG